MQVTVVDGVWSLIIGVGVVHVVWTGVGIVVVVVVVVAVVGKVGGNVLILIDTAIAVIDGFIDVVLGLWHVTVTVQSAHAAINCRSVVHVVAGV